MDPDEIERLFAQQDASAFRPPAPGQGNTLLAIAEAGLDFTPVGDIKALTVDLPSAAAQGDLLGVGLAGLSAIPFFPSIPKGARGAIRNALKGLGGKIMRGVDRFSEGAFNMLDRTADAGFDVLDPTTTRGLLSGSSEVGSAAERASFDDLLTEIQTDRRIREGRFTSTEGGPIESLELPKSLRDEARQARSFGHILNQNAGQLPTSTGRRIADRLGQPIRLLNLDEQAQQAENINRRSASRLGGQVPPPGESLLSSMNPPGEDELLRVFARPSTVRGNRTVAAITKNTIPGEAPLRVSVFQEAAGEPARARAHIPVATEQEALDVIARSEIPALEGDFKEFTLTPGTGIEDAFEAETVSMLTGRIRQLLDEGNDEGARKLMRFLAESNQQPGGAGGFLP